MRAERNEQELRTEKKKKRKTLRMLLALILVLAAAIAAAVGYSYKSAMDSLAVSFAAQPLSVEVGGDYAAMDYVESSTGDVTAEHKYLDADTIGDKTITYTASKPLYGGLLEPAQEFTMSYSVVDTVKPLMLWSGDGTVLERGTEFDINNVIAYGDNADPEPEIKTDGEVDMNTNGRYPLHVTVTDASGNSIDWDLTVEVADSIPSYNEDITKTQFRDFVSDNKGSGRSFGIDVSTWQGDIDFEKVRDAGCEFVIIRAGYSSDGEVTIDDKFEQNYEQAGAAGLKRGVYLYSYDNTEKEVKASADWLIEKLSEDKPELPVVFDWEDFGLFQTYKMSFADLNDLYDVFSGRLNKAGFDCMLYSSKNYLEKVWTDTDTRPVWLAHYTDRTDYKGPYKMWQASSTGGIDGIDAYVDLDITYEQ